MHFTSHLSSEWFLQGFTWYSKQKKCYIARGEYIVTQKEVWMYKIFCVNVYSKWTLNPSIVTTYIIFIVSFYFVFNYWWWYFTKHGNTYCTWSRLCAIYIRLQASLLLHKRVFRMLDILILLVAWKAFWVWWNILE